MLMGSAHDEFMQQYRAVRAAEGWGSADASYYRALPHVRPDDPQCAIWRRRERHFCVLLRQLPNVSLRILDAGAGNGWLTHQLTKRGHAVAALDLSDDARDGLGAHVFYQTRFACYQAEFTQLPFTDAQYDLVIFNAALHYADALAPTLAEARRVLRPSGRIVVMDSPCYDDAASGQAMIHEREQAFARAYHITVPTRTVGFLTGTDLQSAADRVHLRTARLVEGNTVQQRLRRAWTQRRIGREPARFPLIVIEQI